MADDFSFEIIESLGTISESKSGWKLELNKVSWGGRPAKFDVRSCAYRLAQFKLKRLGNVDGGQRALFYADFV